MLTSRPSLVPVSTAQADAEQQILDNGGWPHAPAVDVWYSPAERASVP